MGNKNEMRREIGRELECCAVEESQLSFFWIRKWLHKVSTMERRPKGEEEEEVEVLCGILFFLADRRERAVSSLVYHYDEWPCCGLVTSPAELGQQTTRVQCAGPSWETGSALSLSFSLLFSLLLVARSNSRQVVLTFFIPHFLS